jgi:hypothetical protein
MTVATVMSATREKKFFNQIMKFWITFAKTFLKLGHFDCKPIFHLH